MIQHPNSWEVSGVVWKGVLGRHSIGNCNDNGRLLLEFCTECLYYHYKHNLPIERSPKTNWMHPQSKHWHLLDYVLVRQQNLKDALHMRVMPSCKLNLHSKPKFMNTLLSPSPGSLFQEDVRAKFQADLQQKGQYFSFH